MGCAAVSYILYITIDYDTVPSKIDFWRAEFFFRYVHDPIFFTVHIGIIFTRVTFFRTYFDIFTDLFSFFAPGTKATGRNSCLNEKSK